MKIAIGPLENESYGGVSQHILNIIKFSNNDFHKIIVPNAMKIYGRILNNILHSDNIKRNKLRFDMLGKKRNFDVYGKFISKYVLPKYDLLHLHGHPYWPEIYFSQNKKVYTAHNFYDKSDFSPDWSKTINFLTSEMLKVCKSANAVISVAKWLKKHLHEEGIESYYIPNGLNFNELKISKTEFTTKYNLENFYLYVGRITLYKRPGLFVELAKTMPNRTFVMAGKDVIRDKLQAYLKMSSLPKNVICLGELPRRELIGCIKACRVYVNTCKNETFGVALLEAMGCHKQVVAANHNGPKEIILHKKQGFLFRPDSLVDLKEKAEEAWYHPYNIGGYKRVINNYSWRNIAKKIDKIYLRVG